jgi:hypothetical protein
LFRGGDGAGCPGGEHTDDADIIGHGEKSDTTFEHHRHGSHPRNHDGSVHLYPDRELTGYGGFGGRCCAVLGEAVGSGEIVTDSFGEYEKLILPEDSDLYEVDPAVVESTVAELGFSESDTSSAQRFAVDFILNEVLDSSALDTGVDGLAAWKASERAQFMAPEYEAELVSEDTSVVISSGRNDWRDGAEAVATPLVRDGLPRATVVTMNVDMIYALEYEGVNHLAVGVSYQIYYRDSRYSTPSNGFGDMTMALKPTGDGSWGIDGLSGNGPFVKAGS